MDPIKIIIHENSTKFMKWHWSLLLFFLFTSIYDLRSR